MHDFRPISFSLIVDDFGVKYVGKENADHLINVLKEHYKVAKDWDGTKYCYINLDWYDYIKRKVHLSILGYCDEALIRFHLELRKIWIIPISTPYRSTVQKYSTQRPRTSTQSSARKVQNSSSK